MEIQLFVSDLDGTLLNEHSQVAPETAQAIQCAQQAGIRWLTATGRSWNTAAPLLERAGISCDFVLLNGAELRSSTASIRTTLLSSVTAAMTKVCSEPFPIPARWKTPYRFCTHWRKR